MAPFFCLFSFLIFSWISNTLKSPDLISVGERRLALKPKSIEWVHTFVRSAQFIYIYISKADLQITS